MSYHKLNFNALYNFLFDNGFWIREKRLLIKKIYKCIVCIKITNKENIITWVEPMNAEMKDICLAQEYIEQIKEKINNV